ncbi:MAG: hypothetical protein IJ663_05810 [Spirochaetales bacterium]|nr:hypothetical protein [Spirochaetales bacterium]
MRRFLTIMAILLISLATVFAANSQKIYSVDNDIYRTISDIYVLTGHALPSTAGPWSGDELLSMLEAIDRNDVPSFMTARYDAAMAELNAERQIEFRNGALSFSGVINTELYAHTYDAQAADAFTRTDINGLADHAFEGRSWWFAKDLNHIVPFFNLEVENWLGSHFYSVFDMPLQNAARGDEFGELGSTKMNTNIMMLQNLKFNLKVMDIASFPHRAFAAFGGNGWSFEAGRDRLSWGAGKTGNVVLSDNLPYHDMVRATAYGEKFKYTYLISFFPEKQNYYDTDAGHPGYSGTGYNNSTVRMDGLFFYAAHRFEFRLFKDKVGLALTEGLMYASPTNNIEFPALSPMYFMHNAFMSKNSNSTLALELDWTIARGLNVYGQILVDQGRMPGFESISGRIEEGESPDGNAYLVGAKYVTGASKGVLTINPEFAYVSPFCYLRDSGYTDSYGMDYVGAIKSRLYAYEERDVHTDVLYEDYVIGYKYGPDCMVANLDASWEGEKLSLRARGMFIVHGTHDVWTKWAEAPASDDAYYAEYTGTSSTHASTANYRYPDAQATRNAKWTTLDLGLGASYRIGSSLELNLDFDYVGMKNIFNIEGQNASDIQIVFGLSWKCF